MAQGVLALYFVLGAELQWVMLSQRWTLVPDFRAGLVGTGVGLVFFFVATSFNIQGFSYVLEFQRIEREKMNRALLAVHVVGFFLIHGHQYLARAPPSGATCGCAQ